MIKDWKITTYADGYGIWHATLHSETGFGNYGTWDINRHWAAIRARCRRAIARELKERGNGQPIHFRMTLVSASPSHMNTIHRITFKEDIQ